MVGLSMEKGTCHILVDPQNTIPYDHCAENVDLALPFILPAPH